MTYNEVKMEYENNEIIDVEEYEDAVESINIEEKENVLEKNIITEDIEETENEIYKDAENNEKLETEEEENELEKNIIIKDEESDDNIIYVEDIEDNQSTSSSEDEDSEKIMKSLNKLESFYWEDLIENYDLDELEDSLIKIDNLLWSEKWQRKNLKKLAEFKENASEKNKKVDNKNMTEKGENIVSEVKEDTKVKIRKSLGNIKYNFNDTLEEIESLMNYGESYMNNENYEDKLKEEVENNVDVFSLKGKETINFKCTKIAKPKSILKKTKYNYENKLDNEIDFKIPAQTASKSTRFKFPKSVVSPIGLYIKNSPKTPLLQNVATPTKHCNVIEPSHTSPERFDNNKPLFFSNEKNRLPTLAYKKSSRNIFLEKENNPELPSNIKKLMKGPVNPEVIKHIGRIKIDTNSNEKNQKKREDCDNENNMTLLSNTSLSNTEDVSLYVSKKVLRSNCLKENN